MTQEVLKLALEALETELSIDWTNNDEFNASAEKMHEAITAIKEALAQTQEPVAWVCMNYKKHDIDFDQPAIDAIPVGTMLYTHPSQRTWVGLTDDEIDAIYTGVRAVHREIDSDLFARAIEAKLKEKNT